MSQYDLAFRYDAFISYRHTEQDRKWAKWLVESLETFKVPTGLVSSGAKASIDRVFRDEDELPTSANLGENINPLSPPSDPVQRRLQSPSAKSNFLAVSNKN